MIIGVSGYAQSGKDTVAALLRDRGFERVAFADGIKIALLALDPVLTNSYGDRTSLAKYVEHYGWEMAKKVPEVREYLQRLGTEVGRNMFGETVWVDYAFRGMSPHKNYVITDVRYPNEADRIRESGGRVIRVVRPGFGPANSHVSESALDDYAFDVVIHNAGTVADLGRSLTLAMGL